VIVVTPRAMAAIAQAYHDLRECGRDQSAEELLAAFREPQATFEPEPTPAPEPSQPTDEAAKERARLRAARYRQNKGATPRNSVTERDASRVTNVTNSVTNRDVQRDDFRDVSSSRSRVSEEEEKRKPSDFRAVVAEIESSEKSGSSEFRARTSVTNGVTERDASRDERRDERDVTRRDALRVQRRFTDALSVTWDTHSWRSELDRIACKPEAELAKVLENLQADPWVKDNRGVVTPGHLLKHWDRYLQPPKGKRAPVDETPVIRRYVNNDADAQMRRDLAADRARILKGVSNG
jgi:hypothetical protein